MNLDRTLPISKQIQDELLGQVYGGDTYGLLSGAEEMGYLTPSEWREFLHAAWTPDSQYTDLRNMLAAFVLMSEGVDVWQEREAL